MYVKTKKKTEPKIAALNAAQKFILYSQNRSSDNFFLWICVCHCFHPKL